MKPSELLDSPEKWIKDFWAKDEHGIICPPKTPGAICWCLDGAITFCGVLDTKNIDKLNEIVQTRFPNRGLNYVQFNDHPDTTYEDVISVLQEAGL